MTILRQSEGRSHRGARILPASHGGSDHCVRALARTIHQLRNENVQIEQVVLLQCHYNLAHCFAPPPAFPSACHAQAKRTRNNKSMMQNGFHMPGIPAVSQ